MLKKTVSRLEIQVLVSLLCAVLVWLYFPGVYPYVWWMWEMFMKLLKVFLGPLLFLSIFTAVIGLWDLGKLWKIWVRTISYYMLTTTLAITLGLLFMNIFQPGIWLEFKEFQEYSTDTLQNLTLSSFILSLIPSNFFQAFIDLNAMQIVTTSIMLAIFVLVSAKSSKKVKELKSLVDTLNNAILAFVGFVVKLTPYGVFGIVTKVVAENGIESIINLGPFVCIILLALFVHGIVTLPLLWYILGHFNPFKYFKQVRRAVLLGFSTSSSSATMPVSMRVAFERAKLNKEVVDFTFPIWATVNMDGTAIYQAWVAIFVAQVLGIDLSIVQQLTIIVIIIMASIWAAWIPGAGILILAVVFVSIGLPVEAIGIILAVDRFLDMFRTWVNVWGDLIAAKVVDKYYKSVLKKE